MEACRPRRPTRGKESVTGCVSGELPCGNHSSAEPPSNPPARRGATHRRRRDLHGSLDQGEAEGDVKLVLQLPLVISPVVDSCAASRSPALGQALVDFGGLGAHRTLCVTLSTRPAGATTCQPQKKSN